MKRYLMNNKTHIANVLESNATKSRYDAEAKRILADKTVLAWIMQYTIQEFHKYSIKTIVDCIEGKPEVATAQLMPGYSGEAIEGITNDDSVPGEGRITYDIKFYAFTPTKKHVKIIINVEAQNRYNPGYDLATRSVFYCARMLSSQLDVEFSAKNYDGIKKVYSIWVCMNAPQYAEYTITRYRLYKDNIYGYTKKDSRYNLMESIIICLGNEERASKGNKLHGMLSTLFSMKLTPQEKETILEQEYNFQISQEVKGGWASMCN